MILGLQSSTRMPQISTTGRGRQGPRICLKSHQSLRGLGPRQAEAEPKVQHALGLALREGSSLPGSYPFSARMHAGKRPRAHAVQVNMVHQVQGPKIYIAMACHTLTPLKSGKLTEGAKVAHSILSVGQLSPWSQTDDSWSAKRQMDHPFTMLQRLGRLGD